MHLRTVQRKNKDGSAVRYVQLVQSYRDEKTGQPQAKVLISFGREEHVDLNSLSRLVSNLQRYLQKRGAAAAAPEQGELDFQVVESKRYGGAHFLGRLWKRLDLQQVIGSFIKKREFKAPVERAIFAMVANRALAPSSKLAIKEWARKDVLLPGVKEVELQHLYRSMDLLADCQAELQKAVYFRVADLFNVEVDLLLFDTTSSYFEVDQEDPRGKKSRKRHLRQRGHSKDHRSDLPQVVIGLAVTKNGIPVRVWTWPGNTVDVSVIKQVKAELIGWQLGKVLTVADRGFLSEANLSTLQGEGGHYLVAEKLRSRKLRVAQALATAGPHEFVQHNIHVKEVWLEEDDDAAGQTRQRYVVVFNPERAAYEQARREDILHTLSEQLKALRKKKNPENSRELFRLMDHGAFKRYLVLDSDGLPVLDPARVESDRLLDGRYVLRCSDDSISAADMAVGYRKLLEVESAFRTLKTTLQLRPMYHQLSRRIESHVLLCWLALVLVRVTEVEVERKTGAFQSWSRIRTDLDRIHAVTIKSPSGTMTQTTQLQPGQKNLYQALELELPAPVLDVIPSL